MEAHEVAESAGKCISVRNAVFNDKVLLPQYGLEFQPWKSWYGEDNPAWWHAYNDVKHERSTYFRDANLENCANAISGLFAMVLYCHKAERSQDVVTPLPSLLHWHLDHKPPPMGMPYILPYHVYAFQPPQDKSKIPLT